jgi:hypothetical protein
MNKFEDPIQFDIRKMEGDIELTYSDLFEISQGGPVVGNISINGKTLEGRYGGPALYRDKYVYAPVLVAKFFGTGFKLARINATSLEIVFLGKTKDIIFLDSIEDNRIYFFENMNKSIRGFYKI